jgi:sulfotransferase
VSKEYIFLAGLPRSGSTLLTSILNQNPDIFASSSSPVCDALYHTHQMWYSRQALQANPNPTAVQNVVRSLIPAFYADKTEPIIIDKAFTWGTPDNLSVLINALGYIPKFIVMDRDMNEILASFQRLIDNSPNFNIDLQTTTIDPCVMSQQNLLSQISQQCFIVSYERLCNDTTNLLKVFYNFIGQRNFQHDLSHIVNTCTDDDSVWGLTDMHKIMPTIRTKQ